MPKYSGFDPIESHSVVTSSTTTSNIEHAKTDARTVFHAPFNVASGESDVSTYGHGLQRNGNATMSSTQSKFGTYAAYFDGAGDFIDVNTDKSALSIGNGSFTFEAWVWFQDLSGYQTIFMTKDG